MLHENSFIIKSVYTFKSILISYKLMYTAARKNLKDSFILETSTVKEEEQAYPITGILCAFFIPAQTSHGKASLYPKKLTHTANLKKTKQKH